MIDFKKYGWLEKLDGLPLMIQEGIRIGKLNTSEISGSKANPEILKIAKTAGIENIYKSDEIAWCAVAQSAIVIATGKDLPFSAYDRMRAMSFLHYGISVKEPMLGDIIVFSRTGGGHVGMYVAEDKTCYHVMGGNQNNQYNITRIEKTRATGFRRPVYNNQPKAVKKYFVESTGAISKNEA